MKIKYLIICMIVFTVLFSTVLWCRGMTLAWDHDCENTDGFRLYYAESIGKNPHFVTSISCPNTEVEVPNYDGFYLVTAFNENGESDKSNIIWLAEHYYNSILYEYTDGRIIYKGEHTTHNAATNDANWVVSRYYYNGDGFISNVRIRVTSWDNRASGW